MLLSQFPLTFKQTRVDCDYSCVDGDGLLDHLRDVP